jgi:hypothetical protein
MISGYIEGIIEEWNIENNKLSCVDKWKLYRLFSSCD